MTIPSFDDSLEFWPSYLCVLHKGMGAESKLNSKKEAKAKAYFGEVDVNRRFFKIT